jgi:hypothetical protein
MKLGHVPFMEHIIPLHHLAVVHCPAPDSCIFELLFEVLVDFFGNIFQLAVSREYKRRGKVRLLPGSWESSAPELA